MGGRDGGRGRGREGEEGRERRREGGGGGERRGRFLTIVSPVMILFQKMLMRRYAVIQKARDADVFGILVGTLGVGESHPFFLSFRPV